MIDNPADDPFDRNSIHSSANVECISFDSNGNDQEQFCFDIDLMRSSNSLDRDPDSLSIISDYSEMGLQIKQSIRFSDMIMSTYSDLKNPAKSITTVPNNKPDPDLAFRKYNMLNLALEFSRWKDCQTDLSLDDPFSGSDTRLSKDDSTDDTVMDSTSPSIISDFSNFDQYLEGSDMKTDILPGISYIDVAKSPLQTHIDQKFDTCFHNDQLSSESDSCEEIDPLVPSSKITRPAWAKSIFHRDTLARMPKSIKQITNSIVGFDLSKDKYLWMLNISQLQLVMNSLMTQIEELNETLVVTLIIRDELKSEQLGLVVNVEALTLKARNLAQYWKYSKNRSTHIIQAQPNLGPVHRFISGFLCSPKTTTNRFLSFFTQSNATKMPKPEFV